MTIKPKILVLDIETKPALAYVWRLFDETVPLARLVNSGGIICFASKWVGDNEIEFYSEWEHGQEGMAQQIHRLFTEADAVVTYNGDKFDIPKLQGLMLTNNLLPPPPLTSIDLYKTVKKLGFLSNKLAFVGEHLGIGAKVKHEGFELWTKVMAGNAAAQTRMTRYCKGDVRLTDRLYRKLKPYITTHPHMGLTKSTACGACGSDKVQSRGFRRTKAMRIQRIHCTNCGSWFDGRRERMV